MKRQRRKEGDVVKIDLGKKEWTFARVLPKAVFAFYDCFQCPEEELERIVSSAILFKIAVMNDAVTSGRWKVVGHRELPPALLQPVPFAKQDDIDPRQLSIYVDGDERPATREECLPLERAAVWSWEHVEDRLRDHRAGRPCEWVEQMRIK